MYGILGQYGVALSCRVKTSNMMGGRVVFGESGESGDQKTHLKKRFPPNGRV